MEGRQRQPENFNHRETRLCQRQEFSHQRENQELIADLYSMQTPTRHTTLFFLTFENNKETKQKGEHSLTLILKLTLPCEHLILSQHNR